MILVIPQLPGNTREERIEDNKMRQKAPRFTLRLCASVSLMAVLAGCSGPLDFDMRGQVGGFSTTSAVQGATANRPVPDDRGIISYPNYQVAVARTGDTVTAVAMRIGLTPQELARHNGLDPEVLLRDGEVLALPRRVAEPSAATGVDIATLAGSAIDAAPDTTPDTTPVTTKPLDPAKPAAAPAPAPQPEPVRHKVRRGETVYTISRLYNVPVKTLGQWNGLGPDFAIREGQYLLIPASGAAAPKISDGQDDGKLLISKPGVGSDTPTPPSAIKPLPPEKVAPKTPEKPQAQVGDPTKQAAMAMPVTGKIIRAYAKGRNDGIDIAAAAGTPVKAAADGTVAAITSSADKVPIVVVRHADNLLTVYANVENITVKKGDTIKRGQQLARLRTGDDAYVHFEVRNGFDSVDPSPYLK